MRGRSIPFTMYVAPLAPSKRRRLKEPSGCMCFEASTVASKQQSHRAMSSEAPLRLLHPCCGSSKAVERPSSFDDWGSTHAHGSSLDMVSAGAVPAVAGVVGGGVHAGGGAGAADRTLGMRTPNDVLQDSVRNPATRHPNPTPQLDHRTGPGQPSRPPFAPASVPRTPSATPEVGAADSGSCADGGGRGA